MALSSYTSYTVFKDQFRLNVMIHEPILLSIVGPLGTLNGLHRSTRAILEKKEIQVLKEVNIYLITQRKYFMLVLIFKMQKGSAYHK